MERVYKIYDYQYTGIAYEDRDSGKYIYAPAYKSIYKWTKGLNIYSKFTYDEKYPLFGIKVNPQNKKLLTKNLIGEMVEFDQEMTYKGHPENKGLRPFYSADGEYLIYADTYFGSLTVLKNWNLSQLVKGTFEYVAENKRILVGSDSSGNLNIY